MMKFRILFVLLFAIIAGVSNAQVVSLNAQQFEKKINETKGFTLLDARTQGEFAQGHLVNAIMIDVTASDFKSRAAKLDKSKPVLVYCASGIRSMRAASMLSDMGFKEIYNLQGGISAWRQANKPITNK